MIQIDFTLSEFNISGEPIPEKIADKILKHHIIPMQSVRDDLNNGLLPHDIKVYPSLKSGFRSHKWEIDHGRDGSSQHTFGQKKSGKIYSSELGAVDWTCTRFGNYWEELLDSIIKNTNYNRICIYNSFIHCDYKKTNSGRRELFTFRGKKWVFEKFID